MKKELLHFVEWKQIPEDKIESTLADLQMWGVKNIVAHPVWFKNGMERYVEKMAERLNRFNLRATACHALWSDENDCIQSCEESRNIMLRKHQLFLQELTALNVSTYTIHLGWHEDKSEQWNLDSLRKTVDALLPVCEKYSIALALENSAEPLTTIAKVSKMVKEYRNKFLGMCFDSGHANCYQHGVADTLKIMHDVIVTCHLHDNYGEFDDHSIPGQGNIDWKELTSLLDALPNLHHAETESGDWGKDSWDYFCRYTA